jgi:uncharacterized damage-inducible protein DinB
MLTRAGAQALAAYKTWADGLMLAAVAGLPPAEVARERATPHKSLIGTLNHMYVVDLIWEAHLEGRAHGFAARNVIVHPEISALAAAQARANEWLSAWAAAQTDATLGAPVDYTLLSGKAGTMSRAEILEHIVNHSTYHRGFVASLLHQVPLKAPSTDWNVFRQQRPAIPPSR